MGRGHVVLVKCHIELLSIVLLPHCAIALRVEVTRVIRLYAAALPAVLILGTLSSTSMGSHLRYLSSLPSKCAVTWDSSHDVTLSSYSVVCSLCAVVILTSSE